MQTCEFSENNEMSHQPIDNNTLSYIQSSDELCKISEIEDDDKVCDWPVLNDKALYGFAKDFVELATANSEAGPAAVLATFLSRFGVECGAGSYFNVGDSKHYPRLFAAIVGASSKARKGTSAKPVESLFDLDEIIDPCGAGDQYIVVFLDPFAVR